MNPLPPSHPAWPDPAAALDDALDIAGVMASTGCTEEDLADLAAIFLQEQANMTARLVRAGQALQAGREAPNWEEAIELLRTAAHELTTSFGIVGAVRAGAYSRHTQLRTRKGSALADPAPTEAELRLAVEGLMGAVDRAADLLKRLG